MDLSSASYAGQTFKDLALDDADLRNRSFIDCTFSNCRFSQPNFSGTEFADCRFDHCELTLPTLTGASLKQVRFVDSKLVGADVRACEGRFLALAFENCLIDTCNFSTLKLKATPFLRCVIRETRFVESQLGEASFEGSDLEGSLFHACDLEKASFTHARNYAIDPLNNKLKGATFSLPEAVSLLAGLGIRLA